MFSEAEGLGKYSLPRVQYMPLFHKEGFSIFNLLHRIFSTEGTTVSVATYPLIMRSTGGGTLGWNIEIYSTPTTNLIGPFHAPIYLVKSRLNTPVWGSLRSPNYDLKK